jgi:hypothetical protein
MGVRTVITEEVAERTSARYSGVLVDETGAAVPAASLSTLTLTLFDENTNTVINSVDDINILNADRGTVDAAGNLVVTLLPADNVIVTPTRVREPHVMLLEWTYAGGAKAGRHEVRFIVVNLTKVT